jgi:hypothetical protein
MVPVDVVMLVVVVDVVLVAVVVDVVLVVVVVDVVLVVVSVPVGRGYTIFIHLIMLRSNIECMCYLGTASGRR